MTTRGLCWLSRATEDPEHCRERWSLSPHDPCVIPAGRLFDLITLRYEVGLRVVRRLQEEHRRVGAVVGDIRVPKTGFLVGPGAGHAFADLVGGLGGPPVLFRHVGKTGFLIAPGPRAHPDAPLHWVKAPGYCGTDLTDLNSLATALVDVSMRAARLEG